MSRNVIMEQFSTINRVNVYTSQGWQFTPDANRVRVYAPEHIRKQFGLIEDASFLAGADIQEALGYVDGFVQAAWLAKNRG
jgi:hypothetical protein